MKELSVFGTVYNLVRPVTVEAAARQRVPPRRVSFVDVLRWLRQARPGEPLPRMVVSPDRPDRVEPRVRKRRSKQFPVMKRPRQVLRDDLLRQNLAAKLNAIRGYLLSATIRRRLMIPCTIDSRRSIHSR
jgi:hypothetical protein